MTSVLRNGLASLVVLLGLGVGSMTAPASGQTYLETFEKDRLEIETEAGERHAFEVELAVTTPQKAQGLMFRQTMPADAGMLFFYDPDRVINMWMRNTFIPLDMLFIAADGAITKIEERTVPQSERTISSDRPVAAVLELNGGTARRLGLVPGDRVLYPRFGTAP